jgi:hypothetical protein
MRQYIGANKFSWPSVSSSSYIKHVERNLHRKSDITLFLPDVRYGAAAVECAADGNMVALKNVEKDLHEN